MTKGLRRQVYLSGAIHASDDPWSWRDDLIDEYGYINFISPVDIQDSAVVNNREERYNRKWEVVMNDLRSIALSDAMLVYYEQDVETYGTPIECFYAWMSGVPVIVYSEVEKKDMPLFLLCFSDFISDDIEDCVEKTIVV